MSASQMSERAVVFGSHHGLVGVVTEPAVRPTTSARRAIIVANVGHHHRVGPYRLYVEMARRLSETGWLTLRFDLSGHGDSAPRPGGMSEDAAAALDLSEAMDWLSGRYGVDRFVLAGLCSGVTSTHTVAATDQRVAGAVFIDGYSYFTVGYYIRAYGLRYLQAGRWARYARRQFDGFKMRWRPEPAEDARAVAPVFARDYPPRAEFCRDVLGMTGRGARLLFVFTGTTNYRYNGRDQLFETLPRNASRDAIDVEYLPGVDHLFSSVDQRADFLDRLARWLEPFGSPTPASALRLPTPVAT
jgi:pimeloyl-ACP methyl ester carboxylesterase